MAAPGFCFCSRLYSLVVPKGRKATAQAAADAMGNPVNGYVNEAVLARKGRDNRDSTIMDWIRKVPECVIENMQKHDDLSM